MLMDLILMPLNYCIVILMIGHTEINSLYKVMLGITCGFPRGSLLGPFFQFSQLQSVNPY